MAEQGTLVLPFGPLARRAADERLETLFTLYLDFVVRSLRNMGVPDRDVDDAAQQVFIVLSRKLADIRPGTERAFLFRTACNVAAHARRWLERKRETLGEIPDLPVEQRSADEILDEQRARVFLQEVLAKMDSNTRAVFILYEIECRTMIEIATTLEMPLGSVASRLRRGRALFRHEIARRSRSLAIARPGRAGSKP